MHTDRLTSRRRFLCLTGGLAAGIVLPAIPSALRAAETKEGKQNEPRVNPIEDLMREHGVLRRVLLIYEEAIRRIHGKRDLPAGIIADSAGIIRRFVEDYHEKLEETEIFPRFEKTGKFDHLVTVLFAQHQAGRRLTDSILKLAAPEMVAIPKNQKSPSAMEQLYGGTPLIFKKRKSSGPRYELTSVMQQFIYMYRPHAAREDTVLFPAIRSLVSPGEFDELGEKFEDRERELFGDDGFETMAESVATIEKKLGINDLSKFTPEV